MAAHFRDEPDSGLTKTVEPNVLYENLGNGTFRDTNTRPPVNELPGFTWVGEWQDNNVDETMHLRFVNDFGEVILNMVWSSDGTDQFIDVSKEIGLKRDGWLDWVMGPSSRAPLHRLHP